jgi:hypothetical protein
MLAQAGARTERCLMVTALEIMPVLAMAMMVVLIPVVGSRPDCDRNAAQGRKN